ncbi:hypothetical protein OFM35_31495, partial [Escherichia coli]|nr:hypothetical protein [Escherichia coli]
MQQRLKHEGTKKPRGSHPVVCNPASAHTSCHSFLSLGRMLVRAWTWPGKKADGRGFRDVAESSSPSSVPNAKRL